LALDSPEFGILKVMKLVKTHFRVLTSFSCLDRQWDAFRLFIARSRSSARFVMSSAARSATRDISTLADSVSALKIEALEPIRLATH